MKIALVSSHSVLSVHNNNHKQQLIT